MPTRTEFPDYYRQLFGERWERLEKALRAPSEPAIHVNPFALELALEGAGEGPPAVSESGSSSGVEPRSREGRIAPGDPDATAGADASGGLHSPAPGDPRGDFVAPARPGRSGGRDSSERPHPSGDPDSPLRPDSSDAFLPGRPLPGLPGVRVADEPFPAPPRSASGPLLWYALDPASVVAARALDVRPGDRVLDLCAAPGGKTCILAAGLGATGELVANDRSAARRARLRRVLDDYLPEDVRARVRVTGHDASKWGLHERDAYDKVLLDAPCSSERHVLADPRALREWSPARAKGLARRQYAMLAAALEAVRVGGVILYSTCSLVPAENDEVVRRLLEDRKRAGRSRVLPLEAPFGEPTELGWAMWPDRGGFGPISMIRLERLA